MENIKKIISRNQQFESKPVFFDLNKRSDLKNFTELLKKNKAIVVVDQFKDQLKELFGINNPPIVYTPEYASKFELHYKQMISKKPEHLYGKWVYFPWTASIVHILDEDDFHKVRTARNRNLITEQEQNKFYNATIGLAGLSVGNSVIMAIVLQGGGRNLHLADFDELSLANLNRIRGSVTELGLKKYELTLRQIYMLNPYARIKVFTDGLNKKNAAQFFKGLDIVIDEIDNIAVKLLIRQEAKKRRLPVVMAADDGDNGVVDVERYDLNPKTKFFHGRLGNVTYEQLSQLKHFEIGRTITKHIGPENIPPALVDSLLAMGKTIVSWPQLGGAATLNGAAVAYCVRRILNGQSVIKNRAIVSLDETLSGNYNSKQQRKARAAASKKLKEIFGL